MYKLNLPGVCGSILDEGNFIYEIVVKQKTSSFAVSLYFEKSQVTESIY